MNGQHSLLVEGFASFGDAEAFLSRLEACFLYAAVVMQVPLSASFTAGRIERFEPGNSLGFAGAALTLSGEVNVDAHLPCIFSTGNEPPSLSIAMTSHELRARAVDLMGVLGRGLASCAGTRLVDPKLKLAVELYVGHFREVSGRAKFVGLINVLEALSAPRHRPQLVRAVLEGWAVEMEARAKEIEKAGDSEELAAWESLKAELRFRQSESIGAALRRLVREALAGEPDVEACVAMFKKVYDARSKLVHTGAFPSDLKFDPLAEASKLVPRVLLARLAATG